MPIEFWFKLQASQPRPVPDGVSWRACNTWPPALICAPCRLYPCQSIFVHEFGHAVMNLGMPLDTRQRLQEAYQAAVDEGIYPKDSYIVVNEHEYFATGGQKSDPRADNTHPSFKQVLSTKQPAAGRNQNRDDGHGFQ
eukprot:1137837-Pelagomonas_calceolata.AAC.6